MATTDGQRPPLNEQLREGRREARDLGAQVADIAADLGALARQEIRLARAEAAEQVTLSARSVGWAAGAVLAAFLTLTFLFLTVMFVLDTFLPLWAAALVTTALLAAIAAGTGYLAYRGFRQISPVPRRTLNSLREDVRWAQTQIRSNVK